MRQFSKAVSPVHYKIYEGIYHSLESLLRITQPSGTASPCHGTGTRTVDARSSKTGTVRTRSLFNTCLRVVPAYIKYQEEQATMDSWEPRSKYVRVMCSMSSRIYTTLESLGVSDNGWPHLKSVVRAHAIGAICDAVKEGYCELNFASILTILCTHVSAFHEAEELLASSLNAYKYPSPASPNLRFDDIPTMAPLMSLQRYTKHTGHVGLLYRHLQRLLGNQSLPIEWLATRSGAKLFESALEALSVPSHHQDAAAFIGTAITTVFLAASNTAHHDDKGWIHILVATALDALLSLSLICLTVPGVDGHIIKLLQIILMDSCLLLPDTRSDMVGLLIVVNLIVCRLPNEQLSLARFPDADIGRGAHPTAHDSVNIADIPNFITLLATRYEQKLSGGGFEQLCVILDRLKEFSRINTTGETLGIRRIVVDTALLFAQQHPCRKTIEYAIRTAKSAEGYGLPTGVGCFSYRWEDGIGEWVKEMSSTTLEVSTVESASKNKRFMSDEESDVQTPLRPSLKRRRKNVDRNQAHESHTPESLHHTAGLGRSSGYVDADNCCTAAQRRHRLAKLRSKQGLTWHEGWKGVHPRTIPSRCQSRPFDEFVNGVVVAEDGPGTPRAAKQHATNVLKIVQNGAKVHRGRHEGGRPFTRPSESKSYGTVYCDPEHSEDELAM
jgi:riboflavin synthase